MLEAEALADVAEAAADGERGRGQDGGFEFGPEALAEDGADFDGRGLEMDVGAAAAVFSSCDPR